MHLTQVTRNLELLFIDAQKLKYLEATLKRTDVTARRYIFASPTDSGDNEKSQLI